MFEGTNPLMIGRNPSVPSLVKALLLGSPTAFWAWALLIAAILVLEKLFHMILAPHFEPERTTYYAHLHNALATGMLLARNVIIASAGIIVSTFQGIKECFEGIKECFGGTGARDSVGQAPELHEGQASDPPPPYSVSAVSLSVTCLLKFPRFSLTCFHQ
jgi:hypothetical protein